MILKDSTMKRPFDSATEKKWLMGQLSKLSFGEWSPAVEAYVASEGEDKLASSLIGNGNWNLVKKLAKKHDVKIQFWHSPAPKEQVSDKEKSWIETRAHGMYQGASISEVYDGDMDYNPRQDQQLARSYVIPYVRCPVDYSEVGWGNDGRSFCRREHRKGDVLMDNGYPLMAVYVAKQLPSNGKHFLVQNLLSQFAENKEWGKFNNLLRAFRQYREALGSRSPEVKDTLNGYKDVYYIQYSGFTLFSPITWGELSDRRKAEIKEKFARWARYKSLVERLTEQAKSLQEIKAAMQDGLLKGEDYALDVFQSELARLVKEIRIQAPWLYKSLLRPFYKDIYGVSKNNDPIFGEDGDLLKSSVAHVEPMSEEELAQYGL